MLCGEETFFKVAHNKVGDCGGARGHSGNLLVVFVVESEVVLQYEVEETGGYYTREG